MDRIFGWRQETGAGAGVILWRQMFRNASIHREKPTGRWKGRATFGTLQYHVETPIPIGPHSRLVRVALCGRRKVQPQPSLCSCSFLHPLKDSSNGKCKQWQMYVFPKGAEWSLSMYHSLLLGMFCEGLACGWLSLGLGWTVPSLERPSLTILSETFPHISHFPSHLIFPNSTHHPLK